LAKYHSVGLSIPRLDSDDKVRGEAIFGADFMMPNMLVAKYLPSPYAHAEILSIDTEKAEKLPGVRAVITARDIPSIKAFDPHSRFHAFLARKFAVFVGQPVAAVAADDLATAEEALELIEVYYKLLPVIATTEQALRPESFVVSHEPVTEPQASSGDTTNIFDEVLFQHGDLDAAFAASDFVLERTYTVPVVHQGYIEPHTFVAWWDRPSHVTVWEPTQGAFTARNMLASVLGIPHGNITLNTTEIGGGFGGKIEGLYAPIAILLAKKARKPVRLVLTRRDELLASNPAPHTTIRLKTGVRKDGTLTAIEADVVFDTGAFSNGWIMIHVTQALPHGYNWEAWRLKGSEVLTNKASISAYRAPGGPNTAFAIESQIDEMAHNLNMDPIELRLKNLTSREVALPQAQLQGGAKEVLQALVDKGAWNKTHRLPAKDERYLYGQGVAMGFWEGGGGPAGALALMEADGRFRILLGTVDLTGSFTGMAQIAAETLGVSASRVIMAKVNTDIAPFAPESSGSQTIYAMGSAVMEAAENLRKKIFDLAAFNLNVQPQDLAMGEEDIFVAAQPEKRITLDTLYQYGTDQLGLSGPLIGQGSAGKRKRTPAYSACVAEVSVDKETGKVRLLRLVNSQDVGKAINPLSIEGQMQGGSVQSVSIALWEEIQYTLEGQVRNPGLLDYRMPTANDLPFIETIILELPEADGPYGAKVVGEPSIVPPVAAVANAIANATGVRFLDLPITPERIWVGLKSK